MKRFTLQRWKEALAWRLLCKTLYVWGENYLDQFDMVKFETRNGPVYVNIGRSSRFPGSFHAIDRNGRCLPASSVTAAVQV